MDAQTILDDLLATLDEWKSFLTTYTTAALAESPSATEWSIGQVYRHLIDEANFHLAQIQECLACKTITGEGPSKEGELMLARNSFPAIRINGPLTGVYIPQPDSVEQLAIELDQLTAAFRSFKTSEQIENAQCKALHPGLGYFTAKQWIQFADMHFRHHRHQKRRIDTFLAEQHLL